MLSKIFMILKKTYDEIFNKIYNLLLSNLSKNLTKSIIYYYQILKFFKNNIYFL